MVYPKCDQCLCCLFKLIRCAVVWMDSYCHLKISVEITSKFCVVYCQVLLYLIMSDVCYVICCNESLVALVGNVVY